MNLLIQKIGHPLLRQKLADVTQDQLQDSVFRELITNMVDTMRKAQGVGLAANQVHQDCRLIVLESKSNPRYPHKDNFDLEIWINPKITEYSQETIEDWEGCLSIPGYRGLVPRSQWIILEALNPSGELIQTKFEGFHARVLQHEIDHLHGKFYVDHLTDHENWLHIDEFNRQNNQNISS